MELSRTEPAAGLMQFLDYAAEKGLMNQRTAGAWKSACVKVLDIDGGAWRDQKITEIDADEQFERFSRKSGGKYSPGSLATYGQRFRDALSEYSDFLANPTGFKGRGRRPTTKPTSDTKASKTKGVAQAMPLAPRNEGLITYPFPLENGVLGYVQLPREITGGDVERLCDFVRSLALGRPPGGGTQES